MTHVDVQKGFEKLVNIGMALSSTRRLKDLLKVITEEARNLTNSDAGSVYVREGERLRFAVSQCESLDSNTSHTFTRAIFQSYTIPITPDSIAGYVAETKKTEIIDDAYDIPPEKPYKHSKAFDQNTNYRTRSILTVPMLDTERELVGVLQLINHLDENGQPAPFHADIVRLAEAVAGQAAVAIKNAQLNSELKRVYYETIIRMSNAVEFRDEETGNHVHRVSAYCGLIARELRMSQEDQELIVSASPLHDLGKIGIPDAILRKPGKLTAEEYDIMKTHTSIGARLLGGSNSALMKACESIALSHHEKWNGNGYPNGLAGEDIPIMGRIVALADVFDAVCSKRVYKAAVPFEEVVELIRSERGQHFDPKCVDAFMSVLPEVRGIFERLAD